MPQCQELDFTSWTFLSCAVPWGFCLFLCLWLKFFLLPVFCIHGVRDGSIYGLMQRNYRWMLKETNCRWKQPHPGGWLDPSLDVFSSKSTGMICQLTGEAGGISSVTVAFGDNGCFFQSLQDKGGFKITMWFSQNMLLWRGLFLKDKSAWSEEFLFSNYKNYKQICNLWGSSWVHH